MPIRRKSHGAITFCNPTSIDSHRGTRGMAVGGIGVLTNAAHAAPPDAAGLYDWRKLADFPDEHGVAGAFVGTHGGALIVAGGANFPQGVPWHPTADGGRSLKAFHDTIWVGGTD